MKNIKHNKTRVAIVVISIVLVVCCSVGVTLAYIIDFTDPVTNIFKPGKVSCEVVEETWTDGELVKENVKIRNTGDTNAYIRAAIVINWQNEQGEVLGIDPVKGVDYSLNINTNDWTLGNDGFYYHKSIVYFATDSKDLINSCQVLQAAPADGYTLSVEILATAVQSDPEDAVNDAWGATVVGGVLTPKS